MSRYHNCHYGGVVSALFVIWLILYVLGSILKYCEVLKKISTGQIKISLPAAVVFKRNTLFLSVLLWQKGHKFQIWSTIKFFFASGTLLLGKNIFLHFPEEVLSFNVALFVVNAQGISMILSLSYRQAYIPRGNVTRIYYNILAKSDISKLSK